MKRLVLLAVVTIAALTAGCVNWTSDMKPHVERIEASIAHYNEQFKTSTYRATFKSDAVYASGFPFSHSVTIKHPNLAMVWGKETYAIEAAYITLAFEDANQGRYRIELPRTIQALYAEAGKAPETYIVDVSDIPTLWIRVKDSVPICKNHPGCAAEPEAILAEIGFQPNGDIVLGAQMNDRSEQIGFSMMEMPKALFMPIPNDPSRAISLFVGMLREALVFNPKYQ